MGNNRYYQYYVDGSAVRQAAEPVRRAAPVHKRQPSGQSRRGTVSQRQPSRQPRPGTASQGQAAQPVRRRNTGIYTNKNTVRVDKDAEKQRRVRQLMAMRNREKALKLDWKYTLFLVLAVIVTLGSCVFYLTTQSAVSQKNKEVTELKSELSLLTDTNSATRERINDSIDLEAVRKYATEQLGMVYPSENQIVEYQSSEEDYVKQYQDIPQSGN